MILDANTLEILYEGRDSKHVISDIKFSPNMTLLALGSHDNCVYFYSILDNYSLRFKFPKATGKITHLDFSSDSAYVRINSDAYELLYGTFHFFLYSQTSILHIFYTLNSKYTRW
jgi:WD40 repeat protein